MSSEIIFERGKFLAFKAVAKVHLGAISDDLQEGEVILYDGQTMKRGPSEYQIGNLRSAIKVGWLVPEDQEGRYVPKPAGIQVHDAESHGRDRGEGRVMGTAADEERDVGDRKSVRTRAAAREGKPAGTLPTGASVVEEEVEVSPQGQEGRVIGKLTNPAKMPKVEIGKDDRKVVEKIENQTKVGIQKKARPTGDVSEARSGYEVDELLPDAATSHRPAPGVAGEGEDAGTADERAAEAAALAESRRQERLAKLGKATVSKSGEMTVPPATVSREAEMVVPKAGTSRGMTPVGGAEDGEVVGRVGEKAAALSEVDDVPPEAIVKAKIEMIQQFVPGFQWDMSLQWRIRVKKALEYKSNMPVLNAILSIETEAVRKHVMSAIYG